MITQPTSAKMIVLIATNDYGSTYRYELKNDRGVFIGKSGNCGLQLPDNKLADIHCRVGLNDGRLLIQNWMSSEGTLVNGREITSETEIEFTDVVQVGIHKLRFTTSAASDTVEPATEVPRTEKPRREESHALPSNPATRSANKPVADAIADETDSLLEGPTIDVLQAGSAGSDHRTAGSRETDRLAVDDDGDFGFTFEIEPESVDLDGDFFGQDDEQTFDRETVALLQAEIEDLRAALAERDADHSPDSSVAFADFASCDEEPADDVLQRMEQLIEEANRSDERVSLLEEMLHAAEDASRSEREERDQLEAWVRDIEGRIGQREDEHHAEIDVLKNRLQESVSSQERLQKQLRLASAGNGGAASKQVEEMLEALQRRNRELQESLAESQKQCTLLERRLAAAESGQDEILRAERATLAKEQAKVARLRYELSGKLAEIEQSSKSENVADQVNGQRIRALREHLREIHEQEKHEAKESSLVTRLAKLWKRVES